MINQQVRLRRRPVGSPTAADFSIVESPMPIIQDGEVLRRTLYLSLDPYMRGRMNEARSYAPSLALDDVMLGATVSEVIESRNPSHRPGDLVVGMDGWQQFACSPATGLRTIDRAVAPISTALGVLGMPGLTAFVGLLDIGRPGAGDRRRLRGVGCGRPVVGRSRLKGCRAVGIAGQTKCDYIVNELRFDAAVDYKREGFAEAPATCPNGIDVYFDNVAGAVLETVLRFINRGARIPLCGLISQYNATEPPSGPNLAPLLTNRAMIRGFLVIDHFDRFGAFLNECGAWVRSGDLRYREDIVDGLDAAPRAFIGLLEGRNFGKLLVRVSPDPAVAPTLRA